MNSKNVIPSTTNLMTSTNLSPSSDPQPDPYEEMGLEILREQQREATRSKLAEWLAKIFGCSLAASYLLIAAAAFNPNADKTAIKDLISQTTAPQITLLTFALGFYFGSKEK